MDELWGMAQQVPRAEPFSATPQPSPAARRWGPRVLTQEYKIDYLRPAGGEELSARAWVASAGRRLAVCRCDVFVAGADGEERLCAAQGTIASVASPEEPR